MDRRAAQPERPHVAAPTPVNGAVTTPLTVTGTLAQGVDENIRLTLLTQDGREVATGGAPAGREAPWSGTLTWTDTSWTYGAVIGQTFSPKDGALTRLFAVPVVRADGASSSAESFAATVAGHISLYDSLNGEHLSQLTFPPTGSADREPAWNAGTVVWVRASTQGCRSGLNQLVAGTASTLVAPSASDIRTPRLSDDGRTLAWVSRSCSTGAEQVVSRRDATDTALDVPAGSTARVLDVAVDGALLVHLNDVGSKDNPGTVGLLPAGAGSLDALIPLTPEGSCFLAVAATFTPQVSAWETCGDRSRLVRFGTDGRRASAGPLVGARAVASSADQGGRQLLLITADDGGQVVTLYSNEVIDFVRRCVGTADSCPTEPSW